MNSEKWAKAKEIFNAIVEGDETEPTAFLNYACGNDEELRREVETLLASFEKAGSFFDDFAIANPFKLAPGDSQETLIGSRIGQYTLIKEIGQGGMGAVFLASRADEEFKKYVAIKLVKRGMDTDDILRRFRNERQMLASLNHPNIAKLLDGGTTENGLPFFVMEYIEGQPLTDYCDSHKLSTLERLRLFREICAAVHHAHQNLIVHRDLKPSNIVITPEGTPKLLDFGIAKFLNPNLAPQTIAPTATMMRLMTRDYASPEQVRGEPITTASDIYSLGVLLYELLTGHPPYQFKTPLPQEIERVICESVPERPSAMVTRTEIRDTRDGASVSITPELVSQTRDGQPDKLKRALKGDLDNIILMALRKEPQRRYRSVEQFSEDLHRHLEGLPVMATKDTFAYRTSKFIKRHKVGGAVSLVVALAMIGGVATTSWQARVARQQRNVAEREKVKAESISAFMQGMLASPVVSEKGYDVKVIEVLDESAKRAERDLTDQPDVQASVYFTLAGSYMQIANYEMAEKYSRASLELDKTTFGEESPQVASTNKFLAGLMYQKGDYAASEAFCRKSIESYQRIGKAESEEVADNDVMLGLLYADRGALTDAETIYMEALTLYRKLGLLGKPTASNVLNNLGHVNYQKGDFVKAIQFYQEGISINRSSLDAEAKVNLATASQNLGVIYKLQGEYANAEPLLLEAIALRRKFLGEHHPHVAIAKAHLADLYYRRGEYDKAAQEGREALIIQQATLPKGHADFARSFLPLGQALMAKGDLPEAEKLLREAVEIRRKFMIKGNVVRAQTEGALGECLMAQKRFAEAEPLIVGSYTDIKTSQGADSLHTREALRRVIKFYEGWKKPHIAEQYINYGSESAK